MIGILVPMPQEIALILAQMQIHETVEAGMRTYYRGILAGKEVVVALSRIGKVASATTAAFMINRFGVKLIVCTGVAGGAADEINIGDICIATSAVQHDMDARGLFPQYEIPLLGVKYFFTNPKLVNTAFESTSNYIKNELKAHINSNIINEFGIGSVKVHIGMLASGDQFIGSAQKLAEIKKGLPDTLFVEMEGAAVAQVGFEHSVEVLNIRIISDKANDKAHIDFENFVENAAKYMTLGVITHFLEVV